MKESMLALMDALSASIRTETYAADELAEAAAMLEADGHRDTASAMRTVARLHRVAVLKNQARLAAIQAEYRERFLS